MSKKSMELQQEGCAVCGYRIENPICEKCHMKEVVSWMWDRGIDRDRMKQVIKLMKERIDTDVVRYGYCICCYNELPSICSYCFFYKVARILKEVGVSDEEMENFLTVFNYRHFDTEYVL
jgi:hypothetical protein